MTKPTVKNFIELLQRSKLVDDELLRKKLLDCKQQRGELFASDVDAVVDYLVETKLVSRWQCEKILGGKYKGFVLGKYRLLDHLATGGMSSVYLAEHIVMRRKAAIKVLPKRRLKDSSYLARFELEAQAFGRLDHPNIVRAYDINNEGDNHYIVMEYVRGRDLQAMVKDDGVLPFEQAAEFIVQAALGLQHAHENNLIHRDVKPSNLLIDPFGVVKILDLGLALLSDEQDASLTMQFSENVLGTADYLAPEQALNSHQVDARADVYGLGGTLYFALTGHAPFPSGTLAQRIAKHQRQMPADIRIDRPDCPPALLDICTKMMQKSPADRYASCKELADVLIEWLLSCRRSSRARAAAGAVGAAAGGSGSLPPGSNLLECTIVGDSPPVAAWDSRRSEEEYRVPRNATESTKIYRATGDTVPDRGKVPLSESVDSASSSQVSTDTGDSHPGQPFAGSEGSQVSSSIFGSGPQRESSKSFDEGEIQAGLDLSDSRVTLRSMLHLTSPRASWLWGRNGVHLWAWAGAGIGLALAGAALALSVLLPLFGSSH